MRGGGRAPSVQACIVSKHVCITCPTEPAVVWSGVDADCVSWGNRVDIVSSSYVQIEKMLNDVYEGSEGSIDFYYEKPSIAKKLTETSRDLAMEAFEEGHPHVVYR